MWGKFVSNFPSSLQNRVLYEGKNPLLSDFIPVVSEKIVLTYVKNKYDFL